MAVAGGTGSVGRHVVDVVRERGTTPRWDQATGVDLAAGVC